MLMSLLMSVFAPLQTGRSQETATQQTVAQEVTARDPAAQSEIPSTKATFDIWEYRVVGNSVLKGEQIEQLLYSRLGTGKTLDDVEAARSALEAFYREQGYGTVFIDIPEQEVAEGVVRLHVTEGTIEHVRVAGARYFSNREIRAAIPEAAPGRVPHLPTLQEQLAAVNLQTPDRAIAPVLKAGSRPGTVDLALKVDDHLPLHASVEINDQYARDTSRLRAIAALNYDNLFNRMDSVALQYQTAPEEPDEVAVWAASYTLRLPESRAKVALFYINSDSDVATVGDGGSTVSVLGKGQIYGARYINPFYVAADASHVFVGSVEYKDFTESVFAKDFLRTPISYVNFSAGHTSAWRLPKQQWSLATNVGFGIRGLVNDEQEFRDKRAKGIANYWLMRADAGYSAMLPMKLNLRWRGSGQFAVDPIITNEQFSITGAGAVRGYMEAEKLGDLGFTTSVELGTLPWNLLSERVQISPFVFYDLGRASRLEPLRNGRTGELLEEVNKTLRSAGAGFEISVMQRLSAALTWAYPFVDASADGTHAGDSRIHFSLRGTW